ELLAGTSGQDSPLRALEERDAERAFELCELGRERRLRHGAERRSLPEASGLGDGGGILQLAQRERVGRSSHDRACLSHTSKNCLGPISGAALPCSRRRRRRPPEATGGISIMRTVG